MAIAAHDAQYARGRLAGAQCRGDELLVVGHGLALFVNHLPAWVVRGAPRQLIAGETEDALGGRVPEQNVQGGILQEDAFRHPLQQRAVALLAERQLPLGE